jgi:nicotinate phosphoribosyltransferase
MCGDTLTIVGDGQEAADLLQPVMRNGQRLAPSPSIAAVRQHVRAELDRLPALLRGLETADPYPVTVAPALRSLAEASDREARRLP